MPEFPKTATINAQKSIGEAEGVIGSNLVSYRRIGQIAQTTAPTRGRMSMIGVAGVIGIAVVTISTVFFGGTGGHLGAPSAAAAGALQAGAASMTAPGPPAGEYLYTRTLLQGESPIKSGSAAASEYQSQELEESWVNAAGSGRIKDTPISVSALPSNSLASKLSIGAPYSVLVSVGSGLPEMIDPSDWPTEPQALRNAVAQRLGGVSSKNYPVIFDETVNLLREGPDLTLRSACYQVLTTLPGVTDYGLGTDQLGRSGQTVGITEAGIRTKIILDPSTKQLLQVQNTIAFPSSSDGIYQKLPAGTVISSQIITQHATVESDQTETPLP